MYDSNMQHEAKGENSCERKAAGRRPLSSEAARERDGKRALSRGASFSKAFWTWRGFDANRGGGGAANQSRAGILRSH